MLRCVPILLMLLQLAPARAGDDSGDLQLELVEQTVWVKSPQALREQCGRTDPIRGCTRLSASLIPGPCTALPAKWNLSAPRVHVVAIRVLVGPSRDSFDDGTVRHENHHLIDFKEQLDAYLQELRSRGFASERLCRAAADAEMAEFDAQMKKFAGVSNRRRHRTRDND